MPVAPSPARCAPTNRFASETFMTNMTFRTPHLSLPELWQGHHVVPVSLPAGFVPPQRHGVDGSGHSKDHARPRPHLCCPRSRGAAPDPGKRGWLCAEPGRETQAPSAAASHAPSQRCFPPFHYAGFLIKTERAFFSRKLTPGAQSVKCINLSTVSPPPLKLSNTSHQKS